MKNLILLAFISTSTLSFAQTKLTIQSPNEKVATIETIARDHAYGDQGFWASSSELIQEGDSIPFIVRSFLKFDLSSIPKGAFVNWAKLTLYIEEKGGSGDFLLRRVISAWDQTVNWNTQPTTALRASISLPISSLGGFHDALKNVNVRNLVQNMVDSPATSFGFALRVDSDADLRFRNVLFISPGFNEPHRNPKLVLEYTIGGLQKKITSLSEGIDGVETQMNIYPNPCRGSFYVDVRNSQQEVLNLKVVDILGRAVYSQNVVASSMHNRISLPSSLTGIYFVVLQNNSETILSQKLQVN